MPNTILTDRLRQLQSIRGLTADQVADETGLSRPGWSKIVAGINVPSDETLEKVASIFKEQGATVAELVDLANAVRNPPLRIAFPMAGWPAMLIGMLANNASTIGRGDRKPFDLTCFGWRDADGGYRSQFWTPYTLRDRSNPNWKWPGQLRTPDSINPTVVFFSAQECLERLRAGDVDAAIVASGTYGGDPGLVRAASIQHSIGNAYLMVIGPPPKLLDDAAMLALERIHVPRMTNASMLEPFLFRNVVTGRSNELPPEPTVSSEATTSSQGMHGPFRDSSLDGWDWSFHKKFLSEYAASKSKPIIVSSVFEGSDHRPPVKYLDENAFTSRSFCVPRRIRFVTATDDIVPVNIGDYSDLQDALLNTAQSELVAVVLWTPQTYWLTKAASNRGLAVRLFRPPYFAMVRGDEDIGHSVASDWRASVEERAGTWTRFDLVFRISDRERWLRSGRDSLDAFFDALTAYSTEAGKPKNRERTCREIARFLDIEDDHVMDGGLSSGQAAIASIINNQRLDVTIDRRWASGQEN
jgi:transcriptional regulator with XRE-family HTH domain